MNLTELYANLRQDPAYVEAEENLRFTLDIANSILSARLAKGWSQRELAERVGTRQANISRIECGVANPTLDLISRILRALEITVAFTGPTPPPDEPAGYTMPIERMAHAVRERRRKVK